MAKDTLPSAPSFERNAPQHSIEVTLDYSRGEIRLVWRRPGHQGISAELTVTCTGRNELTWLLSSPPELPAKTTRQRVAIRNRLRYYASRFPADSTRAAYGCVHASSRAGVPGKWERLQMPRHWSIWESIEADVLVMAEEVGPQFDPVSDLLDVPPDLDTGRFLLREARRAEKEREVAAARARLLVETEKERERKKRREAERNLKWAARKGDVVAAAPVTPQAPLPPIPLRVEFARFETQDTLVSLPSLGPYFLRERARLWWVSNQSDDLLALPYCRIMRLEYQIRTALRVIGSLRGRALLSDEVGLGKTIEAGLVLKEYLTRGMVRRFMVLTVPSLVDQWEEELLDKFGISCSTTNHPAFRADPAAFWRDNPAIVASLSTLKLQAHISVAQSVNWDMLVVDEAHYLRNRASLAWQAVNCLPRQFLLLLTATPVQNSLEDLYNLVTLLQPGQLPSPKEFQSRFIDKRHPHRPREPEELRRVLGQIMIRNTRANAGVNLPPRRAETIFIEPGPEETAFLQQWDSEFRSELAKLDHDQASLWGRLLLQSLGSSPAAWRKAVQGFPNPKIAAAWSDRALLDSSWGKKCELVTPLCSGQGGVVMFTQYLATQEALAGRLRSTGLPVWMINGQTPPPQRQPITDEFRKHGGALLLTHSGTEGRNLQFCHRLVNIDLPWNPMEIEQRIGRLHRLGQERPVCIYSFVQKHTLQEHLLAILQEKLNLFELVVGETGLVLGERFSSEEFAEEVFRRWRDSEGRVAEAMHSLGDELAAAHDAYKEVKKLDETLFSTDYQTL